MIRVKSKSGRFIALLPDDLKGGFSVVVTSWGVAASRASWPCSRLKDSATRFEYDGNGNLVDIDGYQPDGEDLLALCDDAQQFGEACMERRRKVVTQ